MKQATVRDLRNRFSEIARWIEDGETVSITKRGRPFAKLSPDRPTRTLHQRTSLSRLAERLKAIYPHPVPGDSQDTIDTLRGDA